MKLSYPAEMMTKQGYVQGLGEPRPNICSHNNRHRMTMGPGAACEQVDINAATLTPSTLKLNRSGRIHML